MDFLDVYHFLKGHYVLVRLVLVCLILEILEFRSIEGHPPLLPRSLTATSVMVRGYDDIMGTIGLVSSRALK